MSGMMELEMEECDGTWEEMEAERGEVHVKRLYSSLWSPEVNPAAAHAERFACVPPP